VSGPALNTHCITLDGPSPAKRGSTSHFTDGAPAQSSNTLRALAASDAGSLSHASATASMASSTSGCKPEHDEHRCPSVSARTSTASNVRRSSSGVSGLSSMISNGAPIASLDAISSLPEPVRWMGVGYIVGADHEIIAPQARRLEAGMFRPADRACGVPALLANAFAAKASHRGQLFENTQSTLSGVRFRRAG